MTLLDVKYGIAVTTYSGPRLRETLEHLPAGVPHVVISTKDPAAHPLAWAWNSAVDEMCVKRELDAVVICNDDVILAPDTARLLAEGLVYGAAGTTARPFPERKVVLTSGYNIRDVDLNLEQPGGHPYVEPSGPPYEAGLSREVFYRPEDLPKFQARWGTGPDFSCFCVSLETIKLIGPFDEVFDPCYFEDNDYHHRIKLAGYEALSYAPYWHYGSQTLAADPELASTFHTKFERCRMMYASKWGGTPGEETFTRPYDPSSSIYART